MQDRVSCLDKAGELLQGMGDGKTQKWGQEMRDKAQRLKQLVEK